MGRTTKAQRRKRQQAAKRRYGKSPAAPRVVFGTVEGLLEDHKVLTTEDLADRAIKAMGFVDLHTKEVPLRHKKNKKKQQNKKQQPTAPLRVEQPAAVAAAALQKPSASLLMMQGLGLM